MLNNKMLKARGISVYRLLRFLEECGCGLSRPSIDKRLKDQKWSYNQGYVLFQIALWEEPDIKISDESIKLLERGSRPIR